MNTILVTGGAGFIGSHLVEYLLKKGNNVIICDNFSDYYDPKIKEKNIAWAIKQPNCKLYQTDIEDISEIETVFSENKIDCVVHLAARVGVRPSIDQPLAYMKTNVLGTTHILELMKKYGTPKMIFASSSSVYGNCKADKFTESEEISKPISPYAATKSACEQLCYTYSHLYDMHIVCLRFFTVFGPRQRPDLAINKFIHLIKNNSKLPMFGDGNTCRDYTYVDDIISGIYQALFYDKTKYEIINLGGGHPITLKEMIQSIENALNKKADIQELPKQLGDVDRTISDCTKAKNLLNYQPKVSFKEGIEKYIHWLSNEV